MQDEIQLQVAIERGICTETARLKNAEDDFERTAAMAGISVLLPQLLEPGIPERLSKALPFIISLLKSEDDSVKSGAVVVLTGVMAASEEHWKQLVLEDNLVHQLMQMLGTQQGDASQGLRINLLSALTSAAQGGEAGAQAVVDAGLQPVMDACSSSESVRVQEAAADLCCQVGSSQSCRAALSQAGAVAKLTGLLGTSCNEVRVRALMALGMLLPNSTDNQRLVATDKAAVCHLLDFMKQSDDGDIKVISQDIFQGLAKNFKEEIAAALREATAQLA